jgi:hypothetical protein
MKSTAAMSEKYVHCMLNVSQWGKPAVLFKRCTAGLSTGLPYILTGVFRDFPQFLGANVGIVTVNIPP